MSTLHMVSNYTGEQGVCGADFIQNIIYIATFMLSSLSYNIILEIISLHLAIDYSCIMLMNVL